MRLAHRLFTAGFRPAGTVTTGGGGGPVDLPPPTDLGGSIVNYMRQPGNQVVVVPNGTYDASGLTLDAVEHPEPAPHTDPGIYHNYLILVAETEGGVNVDLSGHTFHLDNPPYDGEHRDIRILFVGFNFLNGTQVFDNVQQVYYWYCTFTYPILTWIANYVTAKGSAMPATFTYLDPLVISRMPHFTATGLRINLGTHFGIYGCDFRHIGDDGIFANGSGTDLVVQGCRFWDIYHHNHQWYSPYFDDPTTYMHSDAYQRRADGGEHISFNWFGGDAELATEDGDLGPLDFHDNWIAGSPTVAAVVSDEKLFPTSPVKVMQGHIYNIKWFANAQFLDPNLESGQPDNPTGFVTHPFSPTDQGWGGINIHIEFNAHQMFVDDGVHGQTPSTPVTVIWGTDNNGTLPSGITTGANRVLTDILNAADPTVSYDLDQIKNHVLNPANIWRALNPYATYLTFFSGILW